MLNFLFFVMTAGFFFFGIMHDNYYLMAWSAFMGVLFLLLIIAYELERKNK